MPRAYSSPRREAEAAATRAKVVAAAGALFVRDGYVATSMKTIATTAGVSVPTVHAHGPKHALLIAAFEVMLAGDEGRHLMAERPAMRAIMAEPDTDRALDAYVDFLVAANQRAAGLMRAMVAAADADAEVRRAHADLEDRRHRDMVVAAEWFHGRGLLRAEQVGPAADLLSLVVGPEPWLQLVDAGGWPAAHYKSWVLHQLRGLSEALPT